MNKQLLLVIILLFSAIQIFLLGNILVKRLLMNSKIIEDYGAINNNAPKETIQFGQLVGKWNCNVSNRNQDDT